MRSIIGKGDLRNERITFRATNDVDVGEYAILQVPFVDDELGTEVSHAFWFQYATVSRGDLVVVYTKMGTQRSKKLESGARAHFFYWGKSNAIWGDDERAAVLLHSPTWKHMSVADLSKSRT